MGAGGRERTPKGTLLISHKHVAKAGICKGLE